MTITVARTINPKMSTLLIIGWRGVNLPKKNCVHIYSDKTENESNKSLLFNLFRSCVPKKKKKKKKKKNNQTKKQKPYGRVFMFLHSNFHSSTRTSRKKKPNNNKKEHTHTSFFSVFNYRSYWWCFTVNCSPLALHQTFLVKTRQFAAVRWQVL